VINTLPSSLASQSFFERMSLISKQKLNKTSKLN
jgi:hypothetical protein